MWKSVLTGVALEYGSGIIDPGPDQPLFIEAETENDYRLSQVGHTKPEASRVEIPVTGTLHLDAADR